MYGDGARRIAESATAGRDGLLLRLAVDYSARDVIVRAAALAAEQAAVAAEEQIDNQLAEIAKTLDGLRTAVDASLLARYDRLRSQQMVAAAELQGSRCSGCHLDLAPAEMDDVRGQAAAAGGVADCPQCNRLLVVA